MDFLPRAKDDSHMTESISATSALVLLMGKEYYTSGFAKKFLDSMDLNSGLAMKNLADKVWSNYGEIVKNRKDSIYRAIAGNSDEINQVVILACGYDALDFDPCTVFQIHLVHWYHIVCHHAVVGIFRRKLRCKIPKLLVS